MKGYQPIVGSRQFKKIDIPKQLHVILLKLTPLLSAATLNNCHSSLLRCQLLQTMGVGESSLLSQYLEFYQALSVMGQTISLPLTLGITFYFNIGTNPIHLDPRSNTVPCKSQIISIVKKTTHRSSIESQKVPLQETTIRSVQNEATNIPVGNKEEFHA